MSSTDTKRNFLGIPIDGDINEADKRVPQRPLSELEPLIRAVLDDPTMDSFGWTQYTPYFNDGEPCVFSVNEPWFKTVDDVKRPETADGDEDEYDDGDNYNFTIGYSGHPTLGHREYDYVGEWPNRTKVARAYAGPDETRYDRCVALGEAIEGGAFEDVLLEAFGDHCQVKVTRSGITVDEYSHD